LLTQLKMPWNHLVEEGKDRTKIGEKAPGRLLKVNKETEKCVDNISSPYRKERGVRKRKFREEESAQTTGRRGKNPREVS